MRKTGHYEPLGTINYFIPENLPPQNPALMFDASMTALYGQTMHELGKLNEMANRLPDIQRFIKSYVIKEALLSSAIEGVHTTLLEVFTQPLLETKPRKDTQLVMNYTKALDAALTMIRDKGMPIVTNVIRTAHAALMQAGEGDKADPGNFRRQSVTVGNLIPAPAQKISDLMSELEQYINTDETLPPLINAGLAHVQFETIHPFLDGNGRIGRLLIVLMLIDSKLLSEAILYPSYYFKKNSLEYYRLLDRVRTHGDFEAWITFYLTAIKESCIDAHKRAISIEMLLTGLKESIIAQNQSAKATDLRLLAFAILASYPVISINELSAQLDISYNTANSIITEFVALDILTEENKQKRGKLFKFQRYIDALEHDYDLI